MGDSSLCSRKYSRTATSREEEFLNTENVGTLIKLSALAEDTMVPTNSRTHGTQSLSFSFVGVNLNVADTLQMDCPTALASM